MNDRIYLDNSATTRCDPEVFAKMAPYFTEHFGNQGSKTHSFGWEAEEAVEHARQQIADVVHANPKEIIFTSGATEANNIAIKGAFEYAKENFGKTHIITVATEHKCVLDSCAYLEERGATVTYLPVQPSGLIDLDQLKASITDKTALVSVAWVHNEIGVIQPIDEIGKICREAGVIFHTDAAQAVGKVPINTRNIDLMSLSAHKFYGPKGVGVLFKSKNTRLAKVISGGGQEKGLRSGTLPVPLCVGMGEAAMIAEQYRISEWERITELRNYMWARLRSQLDEIYLNGDLENRVPHNLNISFSCVEGESLMMSLKNIAVSSGSACTSGSLEPSYVITALGVPEEMVHTAIRIGFGRYTTMEEVKIATEKFIDSVNRLRQISPIWDMLRRGIDLKTIQWAS
jgi:cysteine desulfurase